MRKSHLVAIASGVGFIAGLYLGNSHRHLANTLGFGCGGALTCGGIVSYVYNRKITNIRDKYSNQLNDLNTEKARVDTELFTLKKTQTFIEQLRDQAVAESKKINDELEENKTKLDTLNSEIAADKKEIIKLGSVISQLNKRIESLQKSIEDKNEIIACKEAELEEFANNFNKNLSLEAEKEFEKRKSQVIASEIQIDAEITTEAISIMDDLQDFVADIIEQHYKNRELLLQTNDKAKEVITNLSARKNQAYHDLLGSIQFWQK